MITTNFFRTLGGSLIFLGVAAVEVLFAAGVWFMISVGLAPALGGWSPVLAFIVAPVIAIMALVMFVYGETLKRIILEYESVHGRDYDEDTGVYTNGTWSATKIIGVIKAIVVVADTAGILYRISLEQNVSDTGKILLFIVLECCAVLPWFVGHLVHIVANRPVAGIQRDVQYVKSITAAHNDLEDLQDEQKARKEARRKKIPATARYAPSQQLPSPKSDTRPFADPHLDSQAEQVSLNQNGQINK